MISAETKALLPTLFQEVHTTFDYSDIPPDDRAALEQHAEVILDVAATFRRTTAEAIVQIGHELALAQERLAQYGTGTFGRWCFEVFGYKRSTAYRYIAVYRECGDCPAVGQTCDVSAIYELSAKSCPPAAHQEVLDLADKEERVSRSRVKSIIRKHSADPEEVKKAKPEQAASGPPATASAAIEQARQDVAHLVRELQRRSLSNSDIASILRDCAATLDPVASPDTAAHDTEVTAAEPTRTSSRIIRIKRPRAVMLAPAPECDDEPSACDCEEADCGCEQSPPITVEYRGIKYAAHMSGTTPWFRRSDASDAGWVEAEGALAEVIRRAWRESHEDTAETVTTTGPMTLEDMMLSVDNPVGLARHAAFG